MDEFNKESNESHYAEANCSGDSNFLELCNNMKFVKSTLFFIHSINYLLLVVGSIILPYSSLYTYAFLKIQKKKISARITILLNMQQEYSAKNHYAYY